MALLYLLIFLSLFYAPTALSKHSLLLQNTTKKNAYSVFLQYTTQIVYILPDFFDIIHLTLKKNEIDYIFFAVHIK